jgi:hypothetical protein
MMENFDADTGPLRKRGDDPPKESFVEARRAPTGGRPPFQANGHAPSGRFNLWVALDLLVQRWHWLVLGSVVCAGLFYLLGM